MMNALRFRSLFIAFGLALLGGCNQELVLVTQARDYEISTRSLKSFLAENGGLGLVVLNGPEVPTKGDADGQIASTLKVSTERPIPVRPIADNASANRIILVFNPPREASGSLNRVCSGKIGPFEPYREPNSLFLYGALCITDVIASHATTISADISPADPRFQDVANAMMAALFPPFPKGDRSSCAVC